MNKRRVVITGVGTVNPCGIGKKEFWNSIDQNISGIEKITRFDTTNTPIKIAGQINDLDISKYVVKRTMVKTDTFTHYALAATKMALADAAIDISQENSNRCGVFIGNNSGGWEICERGFKELYNDGPEYVNPWQATAWFPTAAQGYISIEHGIKGFSKTFIADRVSGASALYFGLQSIINGKNDLALIGGTEAPLSPFGTICYHESGELSISTDITRASLPFDENSTGIVLGEGSTILVLEEYEKALQRKATIYGELTGWAMTVGNAKDSSSLEKCMNKALVKSGKTSKEIGLIVPEGNGNVVSDKRELTAIKKIFGDQIEIITPKKLTGHLYGASTPTDILTALLVMQEEKIPNSIYKNLEYKEDFPRQREINSILVNASSRKGVNLSFVLENIN
ncbi:3-oxoacyl-[acyl-carrier-protein] synthase II [Orenia metallireducens]|uniref:3-oxoacyl-[acyl-carrier-protein] synthase II n=1 Tax=Orenia metallireducens TaxID=1413210 RepID=A0A285I369_9FIRM|nr:beta-ketoacyl synthase N-terminal-like domain-containing protein [Orenia metallireducens]PRX23123.1 3-oxoacyl-[acyl-carrier-protein] synthase II [Orenia metallireducens]SNY42442.1 3-oxoacyl-[acyl-carrier-protein] synthase II [Orenia metallireducens]